MPLNTVTLKWDLTDLIETGVTAILSITPTAQMADATDHVLIPPVTRQVGFTGGTGQLAGIVANDNSAITPTGTGYLISVVAGGQVIVPQFQTQLNFASGAIQWLDQLAPVPVVTTSYQYLPLPTGTPSAGWFPAWTGPGSQTAWTAPGGGSLPLTTLGDTVYEDATPTPVRLPGNTSATKKFLTQTGNGTISAAPAWGTIAAGDLPTLDQVPAPAANVSLNSHKLVSVANGTAATDAAAFGQLPPGPVGGPSAAALGLALLTFPPGTVESTLSNNAEGIVWCLVTAVKTTTIGFLGAWILTPAVTTGTGVNKIGLYSEASTAALLTSTGDMTTAFQSAGWAEGACTAQAVTAGTNYYLAFISNFTGTRPGLAQVGNQNVPALNGHYLNLFATGQADLPATFTPSSASLLFGTVCMYAR